MYTYKHARKTFFHHIQVYTCTYINLYTYNTIRMTQKDGICESYECQKKKVDECKLLIQLILYIKGREQNVPLRMSGEEAVDRALGRY